MANRADHDSLGWDFIVQAPPTGAGVTPLDHRKMGAACRVQVKSMWTGARPRATLSLSAAERLAKHIGPPFILGMVAAETATGQPTLDALYLLHLEGPHLARILKRLREAHVGKKPAPLNKQSISFDLTEGLRLDPSGANLAETLAHAAGPDPDVYVATQQTARETLGYERNRVKVEATIEADDEHQLVDMLLGLKPASVTTAIVSDVRFGLEVVVDEPTAAGPVEWTFEPQPKRQCTIRARGPGFGPPVVFQADLIAPPVQNLPVDAQRMLFRTDYFTLTVYRAGKVELKGNELPHPRVRPLSIWRRNLRFQSLMTGPSVAFEIESDNGLPPWCMTIAPKQNQSDAAIQRELAMLRDLQEIAEAAGCPDLACNYDQILAQREIIGRAASVLVHPEAPRLTPAKTPLPEGADSEQVLAKFEAAPEGLLVDRLVFGETAILISGVLHLRLERTADELVWHVERITPRIAKTADVSTATFERFFDDESQACAVQVRMRPTVLVDHDGLDAEGGRGEPEV